MRGLYQVLNWTKENKSLKCINASFPLFTVIILLVWNCYNVIGKPIWFIFSSRKFLTCDILPPFYRHYRTMITLTLNRVGWVGGGVLRPPPICSFLDLALSFMTLAPWNFVTLINRYLKNFLSNFLSKKANNFFVTNAKDLKIIFLKALEK